MGEAHAFLHDGALNVPALRAQFPVLAQTVHGAPLAYLDNGATTQMPLAVLEALRVFETRDRANIHRGVHTLSQRATDDFEAARAVLKRFIGAGAEHELVFTSGTTESLNLVAQGLWLGGAGKAWLRAGDEIIVSGLEHHANLIPWQQAAQASGAKLIVLRPDAAGRLHTADLQRLLETQVARVLDWHPDLLVHLVHATSDDLARIAAQGVYGVACVRSNGMLGVGFPDLARWREIGVRFALGTDNMMFVAPDMLREMDFASRLGRGLAHDPTAIDHHTLLRAATIEGARALKLEAHIGSLAPGKEASFLVFDLERPHLRYLHDPISAIVHRVSLADIASIYVRGAPLQAWFEKSSDAEMQRLAEKSDFHCSLT